MAKRTMSLMRKVLGLTLSVCLGLSNPAYSLPQGAQVVSGSASFQKDGNTVTINATDKTVVNYSSFDIASGESVIVKLPSDASSILNRVIGSSASQILGNLTSNGLFILVNPNGVYIGSQAVINATNLIISTRDINNADFFSGNYLFQKLTPNQVDRLLENDGSINIKEGGFGVLIAGGINNKGTIIASLGKVTLASGDAVQVNMGSGNGLISVAINQKVASQIKDINGNPITNQIDNSGSIKAEVVMLDAESLPDIFSNAINTQGMIQANSVNITAQGESSLGNITADSLSLNASSKGAVHYTLNPGTSFHLTGDFSIGQGASVNAGNSYIGVGGSWKDLGIFNGDTSTVEFTSSNIAQILGNNIFYNFESMVPNKVLEFEAGDLQTIGGLWKIEGGYGAHERLVSTQAGQQWLSNAQGARDLTYAWVEDGNNINASKIMMTESTNRGNSPGWDPTGTWTNGGGNNKWSNASNWSGLGGAVPGAGDTVQFNSTSTASSNVDSSFGGSVGEIDLNSGYTGTLGVGRTLTVTNSSGNTGNINLNAGTFTLLSSNSVTLSGNLTIAGGTFSGSTGSATVVGVTLSSGTLTAPSGTFNVSGNWSQTGGTFNPGTNTVTFNAGSGIQTLNAGGTSFYNITHSGAGTLQLATNSLSVSGALTNSSGTFDANGLSNSVTGVTTISGGAYLASSAGQVFNGGLTVSGGTFTGSTGGVSAAGVTLSSGTLTAPSGTFNDSGNWSQTGGTFTPGTGTVNLNGNNQTISGSTTFNNLSDINTNTNGINKTLTFAAGSTQTVNGTLTLQGSDSNDNVYLVSSAPGSRWNLNVQGTSNVGYVNVTDSNASGGNSITSTHSVDGGNNLNWSFSSTSSTTTPRTPNIQQIDRTHNANNAHIQMKANGTTIPMTGQYRGSLISQRNKGPGNGGSDNAGTFVPVNTGGERVFSLLIPAAQAATVSNSQSGSGRHNVNNAARSVNGSSKNLQNGNLRERTSLFWNVANPWKEFGQINKYTQELESEIHVIESSRPDGVYVIAKGVNQGKEVNLGTGGYAVSDLITGIQAYRPVREGRVE